MAEIRIPSILSTPGDGNPGTGCLTVLGARGTGSLSRWANPGTDSQIPANCAGNWCQSVSVPGLRRISGQFSPKRLTTRKKLPNPRRYIIDPHMHRAVSQAFLVCALLTGVETSGPCQDLRAGDAPQALGAAGGVQLALEGRCTEAMPLLDQAMRDAGSGLDLKRKVSFAGVRCSMTLNRQSDAMSFIAWLQQAYPKDPEVLFLAVHVFSDLDRKSGVEGKR